jgi:hypothetical protein
VILTVEELPGNSNIQGSIELHDGQWYVFYHRAPNAVWNRRALCVEKIGFGADGLIRPVRPSSSGVSDGLDPFRPIHLNTAVLFDGSRPAAGGAYGGVAFDPGGSCGFRFIRFTGKERRLELRGSHLDKISAVHLVVNGVFYVTRGDAQRGFTVSGLPAGPAETRLVLESSGPCFIETLCFGSSPPDGEARSP